MTPVGMIGLGQIGFPIAKNLMKAGNDVVGFRRGNTIEFEQAGGQPARSAREVAERCKVVFCCIPDDAALTDIVAGPNGIASGDCTGLIVVELSTLSTEAKSRAAETLAARGGVMLDCAVSGIPRMVESRAGVIFVSGDEAVFNQVRPQLDAISTKVFFMGDFGAALSTKLCANMLVAMNIASTAEMLAFGTKQGIDPARLYDALKESAGTSLQFVARGMRMATGDWEKVMGATEVLYKDIKLIQARSQDIGSRVPLLDTAAELYQTAIQEGYGSKDVAAVYAAAARRSGIEVTQNDK